MHRNHRHSADPLRASEPPAASVGALARLQRWLVLVAALLSLAWAIGLWRAGWPGWAWAALLTAPLLHALVLAFEFVWMCRVNRRETLLRPSWSSVARAWAGECIDALQVFGLWQPFLSRLGHDHVPADAKGRRGVVLVHGFVCNRGLWREWTLRLERSGVPFIAVDLEPVFGIIDDYRTIVDAAVARLEVLTGLPPVVVGHSMGGLVLRRWWRDTDLERVHRLITMGSPHHGTRIARFSTAANARQMRHGGTWLHDLQAAEVAARRVRTVCFYSDCDNIVFPAGSATLEGADNRLLQGVGHVSLVRRPEPWQALLDALNG